MPLKHIHNHWFIHNNLKSNNWVIERGTDQHGQTRKEAQRDRRQLGHQGSCPWYKEWPQKQRCSYFASNLVVDWVPCHGLSQETSRHNIQTLPNCHFLLCDAEIEKLGEHFKVLVARVLINPIPSLSFQKSVCSTRIYIIKWISPHIKKIPDWRAQQKWKKFSLEYINHLSTSSSMVFISPMPISCKTVPLMIMMQKVAKSLCTCTELSGARVQTENKQAVGYSQTCWTKFCRTYWNDYTSCHEIMTH